MQTSEARIQANRKNAAKSTGPRTEAGKERSRQNSLKHGLTGSGLVILEADAAEVARRTEVFADELMAVGEVGQALARCAALNSVRRERAADQQIAAMTRRLREVEADFVPPPGLSDAEAAQLRDEAVRAALFDPSPEAILARRYELAAERSFFKAIKELRQMDREAEAQEKAEKAASVDAIVGSILGAQRAARDLDDEMDALYPELALPMPRASAPSSHVPQTRAEVDVPITIGRGR